MNAPFHIASPEELTALRLKLRDNCYHPVPVAGAHMVIDSAGKRPLMDDWETLCLNASPEEIAAWSATQRSCTNTGVLCGTVVGNDIDVLDPELSDYLAERGRAHLGASSLRRVGREPKQLFVYRVANPIKKLSTPDLFFDDGTKQKVEILADGQQFVAFGIHPDTRRPYEWTGPSPLDVPASELPLVTLESLQTYIAECEVIIRAAGGKTARERKDEQKRTEQKKESKAPRDDDMPSRETIEDALDYVPNDFDYDGWIRIGFALYHGLGDGGRSVWEKWSAQSSKNNPELTAKKWPTFASGKSVTIKTLFWEAYRNGWTGGPRQGAESSTKDGHGVAPDIEITDLPPLTISEWRERDLAEPDFIMGAWLTTTSRVLLTATTGLGKSNLGLALAFRCAAGLGFLHWTACRPCRVLYIDGEMSRRLLRQRILDEAARCGAEPDTLFALSKEDVERLAPLNTPEGQAWMNAFIKKIGGVDLIIFDNIMSLLIGDMKDPQPWQAVLE